MNIKLTTRLLLPFILSGFILSAQKSVLTQHNDINRTGWYDNEQELTTTNVAPGAFGKLFTRAVDDEMYAQPLIKFNLAIPGHGNKNVVFAATVNNSIYAFDADSANVTIPYWQINLTPVNSRVVHRSDASGACGGSYKDFSGNMGIVGTPVIDSTTNTMYVVSRSVDTSGGGKIFKQFLHALNISTGAEKFNGPIVITATIDGTGDGSVAGKVTFNALHQNQRSALLLMNGKVFIAWSSHCDWGPYHGWLMAFDKTTLALQNVYNTTPDGYNGGIWMSGSGPSGDENGNVYLGVGNGSVGKNGNPGDLRNRSESALKLAPSGNEFSVQTYFTPKNYEILEGADLDFGVTQVMLVPNTNRAIVGAKDGHIYLLDRDNMGGHSSGSDNVLQTVDLGNSAFLRSAMSYFKGSKEFIYSWSENSLLRAFPYNSTTGLLDVGNTVISGLQGPTGNNGALLSVSSNGNSDATGILWASYAANGDANQSVRPGILRAFDASDVTRELWNSSISPDDNPGNYAKFSCPTIANGKVYLSTFSNQLIVYGLTGNPVSGCGFENVALNKTVFASSQESVALAKANATDGNPATRWASQFSDPQWIYVDLGQPYDICRVNLKWESAVGEDFKVQVSDDANTWTDVATVTGNASLLNYILVNATGRYVRMYGTKRGTIYGYSLYELEVNGKPASTCDDPANISAGNLTETNATLQWAGTAANYLVRYKTVTATVWTEVVAAGNSLTLSDLSCNTPYQYQVQAICGASDSSSFTSLSGFTTLECNSTCDPLPTRWSSQDIGSIGLTGAACYDSPSGSFELKGSGTDIGGTQDQFRFAYKTLVGDGEIITRIVDQDNSDPFNRCGIMIRETLGEGSRNAMISISNGDGVRFQTRNVTDGGTTGVSTGPGIRAPYWLKMVIVGPTFTGYMSPDGLTWTKVGTTVDAGFGNGQPVYGGLAITSHNNTLLSTAHADNFNAGVVLPLQLNSFTGRLNLSNAVVLEWITTRETRTNYFVVERTKDNWNYTSIDTVYAENNGEFTQNYDATDFNPFRGTNYYRLKIVDLDGKISYSPIVAVKVLDVKPPVMYPNPSTTYVNIARGTDEIKQINIYDILGRTVQKVPNAGLQSPVFIPTSSFSNGLFFIEIRTTNLVYREKLIIHH